VRIIPVAVLLMILAFFLAACQGHSPGSPVSPDLTVSKAVGTAAGGTGDGDPLGGSDDPEDPEILEEWYDPDCDETILIVSGEIIICLDYDFSGLGEEPSVDIDQLDQDFLAEPTVQSLISLGYEVLQIWGEVYGALFSLPEGMTFPSAYSALPASYDDICFVGPNDLVPPAQTKHPNDPWYDYSYAHDYTCQWGFQNLIEDNENYDVDAPEGWYRHTGSNTYCVAVIDSGVKRGLTDLESRLTYWGLNVGKTIHDPWKPLGGYPKPGESGQYVTHGTSVAGIVAAKTNNSYGVAGGCWSGKVLPCQVRMRNGHFYRRALLNTYRLIGEVLGVFRTSRWHPSYNIIAINMSYGGYHYSYSEAIYLYYYLSTKAVCIASAGNNNSTKPVYPAAIGYRLGTARDYVIGVTAYTYEGEKRYDANYGIWNADVSAPGHVILTVDYYGATHRSFSGTSAAAPFVSALALLKKSKSSFMSARYIHNKILQYTKPSPPLKGNIPRSVSYELVLGGY